jgi:hypothetical protein
VLIVLALLLLTLFFIRSVNPNVAQGDATQIFLPISQLNFVGQVGAANLSRTLVVVGLANQTLNITLAATDIYDNSDGNTISASSIVISPSSFNLSRSNEQTINITIQTSRVPVGIYQGAIALTSTNATATTTIGIPVTVNIEPVSSVLNQQLVYLSVSQLNFIGQVGAANLSRTLVVVGLTNQTINVQLIPTELYDNATGKIIPASSLVINPSSFSLSRLNDTIDISISTSGVTSDLLQPATYQGAIIVISTNATTTATSSIPVTIKMTPAFFFSYWLIFLISMVVLILLSFLLAESNPVSALAKFFVVFLGILAILCYFLSIITTSLTDPGNIISTVLIAPFAVYLINYVRDLRTDQSGLESAARQSRNKNVGTDIDTLVNVIGELSTHFVSFTSSIYYEKGLISDKVWEKERKEGVSSDFPLVRLEQYYSFVSKYNQYYSYALKATKKETKEERTTLEAFDVFRKNYAELEKLLFVNLQYDLGNLTRMSLSPLKMDYPRITRSLLGVLVDSEILRNEKYKSEIEKSELTSGELRKICKEMYQAKSIQSFLIYMEKAFKEKYEKLTESSEKLPPLPSNHKQSKKEPQIKGTFTVDVKNNDDSDKSDEKSQNNGSLDK